MLNALKREFRRKNFLFSGVPREDFYTSQWFSQRSFFVTYRAVLFTYYIVWATVDRLYYNREFPGNVAVAYLSNWGEWIQTAYLGVALGVSIYGLVIGEDSAVRGKQSTCCPKHRLKSDLEWFHVLQWILFAISVPMQFSITAMYWSVANNADLALAVTIHQHAINSVVATLDLLMIRFPVRLLHVVYTMGFALFYVSLTLILHATNIQSTFYPGVLDWKNSPGISAGVCLGVIFFGTIVATLVMYGLYQLRAFIARKVYGTRSVTSQPEEIEMNSDKVEEALLQPSVA